jgi:hypothetical protein
MTIDDVEDPTTRDSVAAQVMVDMRALDQARLVALTGNVFESEDGRWRIVRRSDGTHAVHDFFRMFSFVAARRTLVQACELVQEVRT